MKADTKSRTKHGETQVNRKGEQKGTKNKGSD